jgi:hypothetical protein
MVSPSIKTDLFFTSNAYIPSLSPAHIDQIYTNYIKSGDPLHYCISVYLKNLCLQYFRKYGKILDAIYQLDPHDLGMYRLGLDAPFSVILGAELKRQAPKTVFIGLLLPSKRERAESYTIGLNNFASVFSTTIDPADEGTILQIFSTILEKPLIPNEEYFLAGVETSKLLYQKAVEEINLRFGNPPKAG